MAVTERQFWLIVHLGLAALFLHSFSSGVIGLGFGKRVRGLAVGTWVMAIAAWASVISGTYIVYPWYRANPPAGADLAAYPKAYLVADPHLAQWHLFGMEWKEHVGWLAPFLATAVAYVVVRYGPQLAEDVRLRRTLTVLFSVAFFTALVAGGLGVLLNKVAPNLFLYS